MNAALAVVVSGFPRRSETFALNELLALDAAGMLGPVFATKPGDAGHQQPDHERLLRRVEILPAGSPADQAALVARRLKGTSIMGIHGYFAHAPAEVGWGYDQTLRLARDCGVYEYVTFEKRRKIPHSLPEFD